jgi:ATP-dependent DNA helicase RecG
VAKYEESAVMELKRDINNDFKKEIIAFANTDGGEIFVGVDRDGVPVGVSDCEDTMARIGNMIRDGIKPDLTAYTSIEAINEDDVKIIRVAVLRGVKRPYHLTDKGLKSSGVFVRHGVSSVPATDEAIRTMLRESDGSAFDKSRSVNQELTFDYAGKYFADANLSFSAGNRRTLNLIDTDGYFTNAALLLSDQCEYSIKCAVYAGTGKTRFKARKEFFGSILKQLDNVYEYLSMNNNLNSTFDKLKRLDHPDYPPYALRETLLNAIAHRDYDYSGSTLINIFDDRIEFVSLGGLVKGLTLDDIMYGVSQPRNTVIANVFFRLELIESYGAGIGRIMESYGNCLRQPLLRPNPASFVVTLPKRISGPAPGESGFSPEESVIRLIAAKGFVTRSDVEALLNSSKNPAIMLLNKLMNERRIVKTGAARAIRYTLPNREGVCLPDCGKPTVHDANALEKEKFR